jgi:hypothetical protein
MRLTALFGARCGVSLKDDAVTIAAFTKFNPRTFLENEERRGAAAKVAKLAKADAERSETLATLATLADRGAVSQNSAVAFDPLAGAVNVWSDTEAERAAIAEYDGGAPRIWAEALARLDPARPPQDVPPRRWEQFIDDCGRFLDEGWAEQCHSLGWRPLDLFGCDRERPWARIDHAGLLWLLDGRKLVALTADTATVESPTGVRQTYYRVPIEPGHVVLAWELPL